MSAKATALIPLDADKRSNFSWLDAPYLKAVVNALEKAEAGSARFVGGCVRDGLFGEAPKDFDIATSLEPDSVIAALKAAGLGAAPTGIDHGTITAISDHRGVEVTSLRADVSTDGRRATVAFTRDWSQDAMRRDFRLNAIYLTPHYELFDPAAGLDDIAARKVQFIGQAEDRIREDYLRILRFFRFSARFSDEFDRNGLTACTQLKEGIDTLSAERVGAELMAILALPRAAFAVSEMQRAGILAMIWDEAAKVDILASLKELSPDVQAELALAALYDAPGGKIGARLRLSNAQKAVRSNALRAADAIRQSRSPEDFKKLLYRFGRDRFVDGLRLCGARGEISGTVLRDGLALTEEWEIPEFTLSGKDVVASGVAPGPAVSQILEKVETRWIAEDFPPDDRLRAIFEEELKEASLA